MSAPKLKDLHKAMVATLSGYREALKKSDDASLSKICQDMIDLRSGHHRDIHPMLERAGETVDDSGTLMAKIQETVIDVRAAVTGLDKNTLPSFIRGEESVAEKYDDAIAEMKTDFASAAILTNQKMAVVERIAQMGRMSPK